MNGTSDSNDTAAPGNGDEFGPREAVRILDETRRQARRRFEPNPPLLSLLRAVVVLAAYGAVWLSVRGQHPYKGPNGVVLGVLYPLVIVVIVASVAVTRRASAGVRGRSRMQPAQIAVLAVAWIAVYVFQGALSHAGASHAIVYGVYPATGPLMIVGLVGAALASGKQDWPAFGAALTVAVVATGGAFAGPAGAWLVTGVGLFAALLAHAAATVWRQRA